MTYMASLSFKELSRRYLVMESTISEWCAREWLKGARLDGTTNLWRLPVTEVPVLVALREGKSPEDARKEVADIEERLERRGFSA